MNRILIGTAAGALLAFSGIDSARSDCEEANLVGSWVVDVTPAGNPESSNGPQPFKSDINFELGGTVAETDSNYYTRLSPELGLMTEGDGRGAWKKVGDNHYRTRFIKVLFAPSGDHFGYVITRLDIQLDDSNYFHGQGSTDFVFSTDISAQPAIAGAQTELHGTRIQID
jgi:hypothetical protein